jgi:hypothetical protein
LKEEIIRDLRFLDDDDRPDGVHIEGDDPRSVSDKEVDALMKNLKRRVRSREDRFPKILFALSRCRIAEDDGFGDLLSRLQMHVDERDKVALAAQ